MKSEKIANFWRLGRWGDDNTFYICLPGISYIQNLVVTSATLVVTGALLVVTRFASSNKCRTVRFFPTFGQTKNRPLYMNIVERKDCPCVSKVECSASTFAASFPTQAQGERAWAS